MKIIQFVILFSLTACSSAKNEIQIGSDLLGAPASEITALLGSPIDVVEISDSLQISAEGMDKLIEYDGVLFLFLNNKVVSIELKKPKYVLDNKWSVGDMLASDKSFQISNSDCYISAKTSEGIIAELRAFCSD